MTLWRLHPRWLKRLRLFCAIVWRDYYGRVTVRNAWEISGAMYRREP